MSCMLKLPIKTILCIHFYILESLLQNKVVVMETFSCMAFHDWEDGDLERVKEKINYILQTLGKEKWWKDVKSAYRIMMPMMYN